MPLPVLKNRSFAFLFDNGLEHKSRLVNKYIRFFFFISPVPAFYFFPCFCIGASGRSSLRLREEFSTHDGNDTLSQAFSRLHPLFFAISITSLDIFIPLSITELNKTLLLSYGLLLPYSIPTSKTLSLGIFVSLTVWNLLAASYIIRFFRVIKINKWQ